jgi:hypothetical protein
MVIANLITVLDIGFNSRTNLIMGIQEINIEEITQNVSKNLEQIQMRLALFILTSVKT